MIIGELHSITTFDGEVCWMQDDKTRFVASTPGEMGLPPVEYLTRRPYKADRLIETGFRLNPRQFSIQYEYIGESRDDYWQARAELLDVTRPNRGGQLIYTIQQPDGTKRAIKARAITPAFPDTGTDQVREWGFQEVLQLLCNDPVWFDPSAIVDTVVNAPSTQLSFPITFNDDHIFFGAGGGYGSLVVPYIGTWYSYPTITITAPFTSVQVYHQELDISIRVLRSLAVGSLILDLDAGTIKNNAGVSQFGYLTTDSDLQGFKLLPAPLVSNGNNTLVFTIPGATGSTAVSVSYKARYIGI